MKRAERRHESSKIKKRIQAKIRARLEEYYYLSQVGAEHQRCYYAKRLEPTYINWLVRRHMRNEGRYERSYRGGCRCFFCIESKCFVNKRVLNKINSELSEYINEGDWTF